jgi:hypothetical protein
VARGDPDGPYSRRGGRRKLSGGDPCHAGREKKIVEGVMRTSILQLQSFLLLRYLSLSHDHEHNNQIIR